MASLSFQNNVFSKKKITSTETTSTLKEANNHNKCYIKQRFYFNNSETTGNI